MRHLGRVVWLLVGLFAVVTTVLVYRVGGDEWSLSFLGFGLVGTFVAWKAPEHPTGRIMICLSAISAIADLETLNSVVPMSEWLGVGMPLLLGLFLLTFPGGELPRPWWRPVTIVASGIAIAGVFVASSTGDEGPFVIIPLVAYLIGAIVDLLVRFRHSVGDERAQMKLVVFATLTSAVLLVLAPGLSVVPDAWLDMLVVVEFSLIPIAVGGAILRYRLYDIDRIISRTISYTIVVGLLAGAYLVLVWLATSIVRAQSSLAVAASTLAVAAVFNPLRKWVLRLVDRRFNRSRYEAGIVLDEFTAGLQGATDTQGLRRQTLAAVERTFQPAAIGLWVKES